MTAEDGEEFTISREPVSPDTARMMANATSGGVASEHVVRFEDDAVTAEDLRAELTAQLDSEPYLTPAETVDGVMVVLDRLGVTALAGDPGDLPARMAAELNNHEWEPSQRHTAHRTHNYHGACAICQEDLPRIAAVAMSVRWEDNARTKAVVERLRAELTSLRGFFDAMTDQRDALKAAVAEAIRQIGKWMDPDDPGPLFAPGFASEVDRTLKKYIGEHVIAALEGRPDDSEEKTDG